MVRPSFNHPIFDATFETIFDATFIATLIALVPAMHINGLLMLSRPIFYFLSVVVTAARSPSLTGEFGDVLEQSLSARSAVGERCDKQGLYVTCGKVSRKIACLCANWN